MLDRDSFYLAIGPSKPPFLSRRQLQRRSMSAALVNFIHRDPDSTRDGSDADPDTDPGVNPVDSDSVMDWDDGANPRSDRDDEGNSDFEQMRDVSHFESDYSMDEEEYSDLDPESSSDEEQQQGPGLSSDEEIEEEEPQELSVRDTLYQWATTYTCLTRACITDL